MIFSARKAVLYPITECKLSGKEIKNHFDPKLFTSLTKPVKLFISNMKVNCTQMAFSV